MKKHVILYAEDDEKCALNDIKNFEENGFIVIWKKEQTQAIEYYHQCLPDILILDIKLKDSVKGGFEIAKKIRERDQRTPILFMTSLVDEKTAVKAFEIGGCDFIRKGMHKEEVIARIKNFIQLCPVNNELKQKIVLTSETYLDLINNELISCGHAERLSPIESHLLQILFHHKNMPQEREAVTNQIGREMVNATEYMKKAVCKLRKLLSRDTRIRIIAKRKASIMMKIDD